MQEQAVRLMISFTPEEIAAQARDNLNAVILGSLAYARAYGRDGRHWARALGQIFAVHYEHVTSPAEAAVAIARNCASIGMRVLAVDGDERRAEVVVSNWPGPDDLDYFGLTQAGADQLWFMFEPIMQFLGYSYSWRRDGDRLHFMVAR